MHFSSEILVSNTNSQDSQLLEMSQDQSWRPGTQGAQLEDCHCPFGRDVLLRHLLGPALFDSHLWMLRMRDLCRRTNSDTTEVVTIGDIFPSFFAIWLILKDYAVSYHSL